jgi:hypothetical protein
VKHTSATLLALAALAPAAYALSVEDADVKLGVSLQLQARADKSWANDGTGNRFDTNAGASQEPDDLDFYMRRVRVGFKGTYKGSTSFNLTLRADNLDRKVGASDPASGNRYPEVQQAFIAQDFKGDGMTQQVRAGLDYAFFNGASAIFSSTTLLFPTGRATEQSAMLAPRGTGVGYKLSNSSMTWGFDIQNNTGDDTTAGNTGAAQNGEGMCYTTRFQMMAIGDQKFQESFLGAEGTNLGFSIEAGINRNNNVAPVDPATTLTTVNTRAIGIEALFHQDGLTALAEWRCAKDESQVDIGSDGEKDKRIWLVQAGYALPMADSVVEPAFRFSRINLDDDSKESKPFGSGDYGASGYQTELGVNWYLAKANNKLSIQLIHWRAEEGEAKADVLRTMWQLYF